MKTYVLLCLVAAAIAKNEVYEGYKSYYVSVSSTEQQRAVHAATEHAGADVLSHPLVGRAGVVLVPPAAQKHFLAALDVAGAEYSVHREDVKAALDYDDTINERSRLTARARNGGRNLPYDNYQELQVIEAYMADLAAQHPERVTLVRAGDSFEGRPLHYLRVSSDNFQNTSKPVIIIDGGIHAREWISPPAVTWAMHKLVEDVTDSDLADLVDWILLPVVNPDGYEYTFTDVRMWRKTRSTEGANGATCPGVDGNRNYDFAWNSVGTSDNPCADTYAGPSAFSEPETRVVRDLLAQYRHRLPLYITVHSYGSMILYPWGHDSTLSWNAFSLHTVGVAMARAMDALQHESFPNYIVGNSGLVIGYEAAGAAEDYAHSIGVPIAFTIELPGLSGGFEGFHLPPEWIERVVQETWAGVAAGARSALAITGHA